MVKLVISADNWCSRHWFWKWSLFDDDVTVDCNCTIDKPLNFYFVKVDRNQSVLHQECLLLGNRENDKKRPGEKMKVCGHLVHYGPLAVEHFCIWHLEETILSPTENFFLLLQSQDWITRQIKIFGSSKKRGKTQQRILSDCHGCRILTWKPSLPVYLFKKVPIEYF